MKGNVLLKFFILLTYEILDKLFLNEKKLIVCKCENDMKWKSNEKKKKN